ncbi:MAG TPA: hypothetical protein VEF05_06020 [Terriglobales bacterium]|nr:hypothetical protein [Terriglobales bacterium]
MTLLSYIWHGFWFAQSGLRVLLLLLVLRRKFYKPYPVFAVYVGWAALRSVILLFMNYAPFVSGNQYYQVHAASSVIDAVLRWGIIYEMFDHVFRDYATLRNLGPKLFRWATLALIIGAIVLAWFAPASGLGRVMSTLYAMERNVNVLLCGLLIVLLALAQYFRLSWRSPVFGIALGLGIMAASDLGTYAIRSQIEPISRNLSTDVLDLIIQAATLCCVLIWTAYLLAPERKPVARVVQLPPHDLETWNHELERLLHP